MKDGRGRWGDHAVEEGTASPFRNQHSCINKDLQHEKQEAITGGTGTLKKKERGKIHSFTNLDFSEVVIEGSDIGREGGVGESR